MKSSNDTIWNRTSYLLFVAQHLNHFATAVPQSNSIKLYYRANYVSIYFDSDSEIEKREKIVKCFEIMTFFVA
jgi:hypothetical protein